MRRKIISFMMSICLILPFAIIFSACTSHEHEAMSTWEYDATHHWHKCKVDDACEETLDKATHTLTTVTVTPATIDSEGSEKQVCACGYETTPTAIPKLVQSTDDMLGILHRVATDDTQYTYIEVDSYYNLAGLLSTDKEDVRHDITYFARNDEAIVAYIAEPIENKPASWIPDEYITFAQYIVTTPSNNTIYRLGPDPDGISVVVNSEAEVSDRFVENFTKDKFDNGFAFARICDNENDLRQVLKTSTIELLEIFAQDYFTYGYVDKDDIDITINTTYANQKYALNIGIFTDDIRYTAGSRNTFKINEFTTTYTVEFTKDTLLELYCNIEADVTRGTDTIDTSDDTPYTMQNITTISTSTDTSIVDSHINKMANYTEGENVAPYERREQFAVYIDGIRQLATGAVYGTEMNSILDDYLAELNTTYEGVATFTAYLDEDMTIPYVASEPLVLEAYYGTNVYVKITLLDTTKAIVHTRYYNTYSIYRDLHGHKLDIVDAGEYTIDSNYSDTDYTAVMLVDNVPKDSATITLEAGNTYKVDCEKTSELSA